MPTSSTTAQRLLVLQSGKEVTWGTGLAATAKWMAVKPYPEFKPYRKSTVFDEARGNLAPGFNNAILRKGGEYKIDGYLTFEDAILLGHNFFGTVAPSGSAPYVYSYTGPTTAQPTMTSFTFEYNQPSYNALATGCIANKLEIKGNAEQAMEYTLSGLAQDIDTGTGSSVTSLTDRTVEIGVMINSSVWMDPGGSTVGTTAFNNVMMSYNLTMENSIKFIYTAGSILPTQWVMGDRFKSNLTIDLLYTSAVRTFLTGTLMNGTQAVIRFKITGSGSKYVQLDFAGVLADDPALFGNKEGAQMVQIKLDGIYNTTNTLYTNMTVANTVSAVP